MKLNKKKLLMGLLCLSLCAVFATVLLCYTMPMDDVSLDISPVPNEGDIPESMDSTGWTVFVQEGEEVTPLTYNGMGSFTGLELGQTFYFSRVMVEEMDSPTLQLGTYERNFAVFLDGDLIYTDCPELDNRIGYLKLPMSEWVRTEPLTISLPSGYVGKTLTIAQSFPDWSETETIRATTCSVRLYCGYAYESTLISQSFQRAYTGLALFLIAALLLVAFLRSENWDTLCAALMAFLLMCQTISRLDFFVYYFSSELSRFKGLILPLMLGVLLLWLTMRAKEHRKWMMGLTGLYAISLAAAVILKLRYEAFPNLLLNFVGVLLPEWIAAVSLTVVLVLELVNRKKRSGIMRLFAPLTLGLFVLFFTASLITDADTLWYVAEGLRSGQITMVYTWLAYASLLSMLVTALWDAAKSEWERIAQKRLEAQRQELTLANYENLRRHQEEVMSLRHDMLNHYRTLQEMDSEEQRTAYLAELIGQNKKIRPVVQSGNEMLDIILNSKLGAAIDSGIRVEIVSASAPEKLPLKDADLCSLVMNIVDNAVSAARKTDDPFLSLDIHVTGNFLAIVCENSADAQEQATEAKKETVPKHGLGLKIVGSITERYEGVIDAQKSDNMYRVRVILPLR